MVLQMPCHSVGSVPDATTLPAPPNRCIRMNAIQRNPYAKAARRLRTWNVNVNRVDVTFRADVMNGDKQRRIRGERE